MTPEAQNIAIAKAMGLTWHRPTQEEVDSGSYYSYSPDFTSSLESMAAAEETLTDVELVEYASWLEGIVGVDVTDKVTYSSLAIYVRASATQRAEAFLRAKGLWT